MLPRGFCFKLNFKTLYMTMWSMNGMAGGKTKIKNIFIYIQKKRNNNRKKNCTYIFNMKNIFPQYIENLANVAADVSKLYSIEIFRFLF